MEHFQFKDGTTMSDASNYWANRSIDIANNENYLDRLQEEGIYPVIEATERDLPDDVVEEIVKTHNRENREELMRNLLKLDKFPIDDIYVGFLRKGEDVIENNPETVGRITDRILSMNVEEVLTRCRQPKVTNRQMGQMFRKWTQTLEHQFLDKEQFETEKITSQENEIVFFKGSPSEMKDYANDKLGCGLDIEPDVLLRIDGNHIVGEAKYLSGFGGHQDRQFEKVLDFIQTVQGNAERVAIIDGVPWLDNVDRKMSRKIRRITNPTMTALLFEEYLADKLGNL